MTAAMHPLTLLAAALGWNYVRHKRGRSTICSVSRLHVKPVPFLLGWLALTLWLIPHYLRPFRKDTTTRLHNQLVVNVQSAGSRARAAR